MNEYFSDEFLDNLSDDKLIALNSICTEFRNFASEAKDNINFIEDYFKALAIFKAFASTMDYPVEDVKPGNDPSQNINNIRNYLFSQEAETSKLLHSTYLEEQTRKYTDRFNSLSAYSFSDDDFAEIQKLINEMRDIIGKSQIITDNHKKRLLERLERLQRELHKNTSDLDRFWGFIGEAGIVIGKFGNDIKPLVDRIRELAEIVWKTISIKEKLLGKGSPIMIPNSDIIDDKDSITT